MKTKVLFVCLGNICRSPLAEGIFKDLVAQKGLKDNYEIDSAGTSDYHIGELADLRTRENAQSHGIELTSKARQVSHKDFEEFDFILAADQSNYEDLLQISTQANKRKAKLLLIRAFDHQATTDTNVPDPYYGGERGFEEVYQILMRSMNGFIEHLENTKS